MVGLTGDHEMKLATTIALLAALALAAGCGAEEKQEGEGKMLTIQSPAFEHDEPIPEKYTGDGEDVSPPLVFDSVPEGTVELALICDDPDAPTPEPWVHWVIYKIPADIGGLEEGASGKPGAALEGTNSWSSDNRGYRGPKPPSGTHRYFFRLYALDTAIELSAGATKDALLRKIEGHVLAEAVLIGLYSKK
ncbi:MAG: YbhB/YbcL family Raf kinase inhibitor-like protein [Planctomycetota bacterium]|jgi:Raf kinase inhibitor-like YbhB/YbcL family protein